MDFRAFLVSKVGNLFVFLISAGLAALLGWFGATVPALHVEMLVNAAGGQLVVTLLILGLIREGLNWLVAHWAGANLAAVKVIQEALNDQVGAGLKTDGLLQQGTATVIDRLFGDKANLPIEQIPAAAKNVTGKIVTLLIAGLFLGGGALLIGGCGGGPQGSMGITTGIPLGSAAKFGTLVLGIGYAPPPSLYAIADAPAGLSLSDFKSVLKPR